ncbi:MAG TPA: glycosyltransferase N-terminal domain-containing protein [Elusimicrobiales bacterium]|nr:glycosyltransferase N-terminal domain-containing protein [Elusimicrobiales bacterium]
MAWVLLIIINLLFPFIALGYLLAFFLSPRKNLLKNLSEELPQRFGVYKKQNTSNVTWIHAASVGEVKSVKQIVKFLKVTYPDTSVVITTSTEAGKLTAKKILGNSSYLAPVDFYPITARFIKTFKPARLFVFENELWPNMFTACKNNNIPIGIINGRMSQKSFKGLKLLKPLTKFIFENVSFACVQTREIAKRYIALGLEKSKIHVTGNIKYDMLDETPRKTKQVREIISKLNWQNSKILVCGSTHPQEENAFISVMKKIGKDLNLKFIIAPRHMERIQQVKQNLTSNGIKFTSLTQGASKENTDCLLVDEMGWLTSFYKMAHLCFVGGTLVQKGGHNLLEPAILQKPILMGKHTLNSPDVAQKLIENKAAKVITEKNLSENLTALLKNENLMAEMGQNAYKTALHFQSATEKTLQVLEKYYEPKS